MSFCPYEFSMGFPWETHGIIIPWNHHGKFKWVKTRGKLMNFDGEFSMKLENKTNDIRAFSYFMERHLKPMKSMLCPWILWENSRCLYHFHEFHGQTSRSPYDFHGFGPWVH